MTLENLDTVNNLRPSVLGAIGGIAHVGPKMSQWLAFLRDQLVVRLTADPDADVAVIVQELIAPNAPDPDGWSLDDYVTAISEWRGALHDDAHGILVAGDNLAADAAMTQLLERLIYILRPPAPGTPTLKQRAMADLMADEYGDPDVGDGGWPEDI